MLNEWLRSLPYLVHTNRELGLMLRGIKPLAYFADVVGHEPEVCLRYWRMFDRHVAAGSLIKRDVFSALGERSKLILRRRFYTLPGHEWRIDAMLRLLDAASPWCDDHERRFGELLGYQDWQNDFWLEHRRLRADT